MTSPYLEPVASAWARAAGFVLLVAAVVLTAVLGIAAYGYVGPDAAARAFTSSTLVFGLVLLALCGICWQAGYRLALRRPGPGGMLFSRVAWGAIGTGLVALTALMAGVIARGRGLTLFDIQFVLFFGGIGVWCFVLAFRGMRDACR